MEVPPDVAQEIIQKQSIFLQKSNEQSYTGTRYLNIIAWVQKVIAHLKFDNHYLNYINNELSFLV